MTNSALQFDLIISGGGLAGASMALALARLKKADGSALTIAIVESHPLTDGLPKSYDARVIALSHGSASYLNDLGVWPTLKSNAMAIKQIHISDRGHYGKARLNSNDYNVSALGFVSEMQAIGHCLLEPLKQYTNVQFFAPNSIDTIDWQAKQVSVQLKSGAKLTAALLLGCDGGQSQCRAQAHIASRVEDYQQVAIIANVSTSKTHNNRAFERFTEFGPLALLPMTGDRCSLVWTVAPEHVDKLLALTDNEFAVRLGDEFGSWLGNFTQIGQRFSFELKLIQAEQQINHRLALLGNASHTLHPIAGQGFNLGMRDVKVMAECISQALANNLDIGSQQILADYAQQRASDHQQVIALTDSLVHLFSNQYLPLVLGRGLGLKVVNYLSPLKTAIAKKTMGHTH